MSPRCLAPSTASVHRRRLQSETINLYFFLAVVLTHARGAAADYRLTNGSSTETVWVAYSRYLPAGRHFPAGWRTGGWFLIKPGATKVLGIPQGNKWVYIRVTGNDGREITPLDHATRESSLFWIDSAQRFSAVETNDGNLLPTDSPRRDRKQAAFYEYRNHSSHIVFPNASLNLPDLSAAQLSNQAIHSVLFIRTETGWGGGAVLIDKQLTGSVLTRGNDTRGDGGSNLGSVSAAMAFIGRSSL